MKNIRYKLIQMNNILFKYNKYDIIYLLNNIPMYWNKSSLGFNNKSNIEKKKEIIWNITIDNNFFRIN